MILNTWNTAVSNVASYWQMKRCTLDDETNSVSLIDYWQKQHCRGGEIEGQNMPTFCSRGFAFFLKQQQQYRYVAVQATVLRKLSNWYSLSETEPKKFFQLPGKSKKYEWLKKVFWKFRFFLSVFGSHDAGVLWKLYLVVVLRSGKQFVCIFFLK